MRREEQAVTSFMIVMNDDSEDMKPLDLGVLIGMRSTGRTLQEEMDPSV